MRRSHSDEPQLITTAPESSDDEFDRRKKRYAITMSVRALCVLLAAVTYNVSVGLAIAFAIGGMVLPGLAVIIANDGPPKKKIPAPSYSAGYSTERSLTAGRDDSRTVDG